VDGERFEIARPLDLQLAVLRCQRSALLRAPPTSSAPSIATIVSELGSNVLKYAVPGTLELRRVRREGAPTSRSPPATPGPASPTSSWR
jgi:anti-sigma regulatory factor (Ser/Thr protein kinase)